MKSNHQILTTAYQTFNARDIEGVLSLMHPDVDWPNGMEGGRLHGHREVRDYWTRQWSVVNPHVEPVSFEEDSAGRTIVDVHQVVRDQAENILVDQIVRHIYTIHDGLIQHMEIRHPPEEP